MKSLAELIPGESGTVQKIEASEIVTLKLLELGIAPGEVVKCCRKAPLGDPIEIEVLHYRLAIRRSEAAAILLGPE